MASPTRAEIEAVVTTPTYAVEYWNGSAWTAITSSWVKKISGAAESTGGDNGVGLGAEATAKATIELDLQADSIAWDGTRVRASYGFAASDKLVRVQGMVTAEDGRDEEGLTWTVAGWDELITKTPVYSPLFYRRPASTATTLTSGEDPSGGGYSAGLVNYIFWTAGGRPLEQAASYPTAVFYYSCDTAIIAPEWSWAAGENAWEELGRIARACGLVIYQAADGTMRCQHALNIAGSGSYTFDSADFKSISRKASRGEKVATARCSYTARRLQPQQIVYEDTTPRIVLPLDTLTVMLEMSQPVYDYVVASGSTLPTNTITGCTTEGLPVSCSATIVSQAASRIEIQVGNPGNDVMIISRIQVRGRPVAPVEEGIVRIGSGTPEVEMNGDTGVYVQSRRHAERICKLWLDLYSTPRTTYTLSSCGYDPDRSVGESVGLTYAAYGLSAVACRITAIRHSDTGATMDVDLVPTSGLPTLAESFVVGTAYSSGDVRLLSY